MSSDMAEDQANLRAVVLVYFENPDGRWLRYRRARNLASRRVREAIDLLLNKDDDGNRVPDAERPVGTSLLGNPHPDALESNFHPLPPESGAGSEEGRERG